MWFYFSIFIILGLLSFIEIFYGYSKKVSIILSISVCFFWGILSCIRNGGPGDWNNYSTYYLYFNYNNIFTSELEPLYGLLNCISKSIYPDYHFFLFLENLIVMPLTCYSVLYMSNCTKGKKWCRENSFAVTTLLIIWAISFGNIFIIRSTIALVLCMFSVRFIEHRKFIKFFITLVLAMGFHRTAIFFLPAYWLYNIKIKRKYFIIIFLGTIVIASFFNVNPLLINVANFLGDDFGNKMELYTELGYSNTNGSNYSILFLTIKAFINVGVLATLFFWMKKYFGEEKKFDVSLNIYSVGASVYIFSLMVLSVLARIAGYYIVFQMFLLPYVFRIKTNKSFKIIIYFVFITYLALRMVTNLGNFESYIPFQTIFNT